MKSSCTLSIIIVTKNRAALLSKALRSLIGQCKRGDEIIVVDASTDETPHLVSELSKQLPISYIRFMPKGYPLFYNEGARHARGDVLVFYDDDCIASPDYLERIRFAHRTHKDAVIQGKTYSIPRGNIYVDTMSDHYTDWLQAMTMQKNMLKAFDSKNASIPRALFWRYKGFSTKMTKGSEDIELGMRMRRDGVPILYDPSIVAYHHERATFVSFFLQHVRIAQSEVALDRQLLTHERLGIIPKRRYALHAIGAIQNEWKYFRSGNIAYACQLPLVYMALLIAKIVGFVSMHMPSAILRLWCVAFIAVVVSLFIGEAGLHVVGYVPVPYTWQWAVRGYYKPNSSRIYALVPEKVATGNPLERTDKIGFRFDPSDNNDMRSGDSVIMFGDSAVYGYRMNDDETFPYIAEQYIRGKGKNVDVINAGVPGYGLDQTYVYIREVLSKYTPRAIVWNINENDILDANDACLFVPAENGGYKHVSAMRQTLYIQGEAARRLPGFIYSSNIINLLFAYMQHGHGRYTIGCTLPYKQSQQIVTNGLRKLTYFMTNIEETAKAKNVQVLYTLLPTESYFHPTQVPQTSDQIALLERIRQTVNNHGDSIIDMNELLATRSFRHVLAVRTNQQDVLGATDENAESLFLPVSQDNGYRHLSREGNALDGQLVGQVLMERILDK